jgi:hypothetical protein
VSVPQYVNPNVGIINNELGRMCKEVEVPVRIAG